MKLIPFTDKETLYEFSEMIPADIDLGSRFLGIGAVDDKDKNKTSGVIVGSFSGLDLVIRWIYVREKKRQKGIGRALLNKFLDVVVESGNLLDVNATYRYSKETEAIHALFGRSDRINLRCKCEKYGVTKKERQDSEHYLKLSAMKAQGVNRLNELKSDAVEKFLKRLDYLGYSYVDDYTAENEDYIQELCYARYAGNEVKSAVFFRNAQSNHISLAFAYATGGGINLAQVLMASSYVVEEKYSNYILDITPITNVSDALVNKLFPSASPDALVFVAEWNFL